MLGYYGYTVWLTYLSLISAVTGIFVCFMGDGHPYYGIMCLMISGLCDAFDGKVARTKKNRTDSEKKYGIQIDSLSDIVAFGVLPTCIGAALYRAAGLFDDVYDPCLTALVPYWVYVVVFVLYILAALIRLAYFNVTEEERQKTTDEARKTYRGIPVTSASIVLPTFMLINHFLDADITIGYYAVLLLMAFGFVSNINIRKPNMRDILIMVGIGLLEFIAILLLNPQWQHGL